MIDKCEERCLMVHGAAILLLEQQFDLFVLIASLFAFSQSHTFFNSLLITASNSCKFLSPYSKFVSSANK